MGSNEEDPTRELEKFLAEELTGRPQATVVAPEDAPEVVRDEPPGRQAPPEPEPAAPEPEEPQPDESEPEEPDAEDDPDLVWAQKRYGEDPSQWAKAARAQERQLSTLTNEKHASDEMAQQWYQYAQQQEAQGQTQFPLSSAEENWIEQSLSNPLEYARQAAFNGKLQLFNGVLERVALESPQLAGQISAQVQMDLQSYVNQHSQQQQVEQSLEMQLAHSFDRLGLNLQREGPKMLEKVRELGEYHPYVRAIIGGNDGERDLGVQAVHDLTRASTFNSRQVEHNKAVQKEEELRRGAMVVQTGSMQPPAQPRKATDFEKSMEAEWRRAGQWPYPEE